jgi:hypothetical protein
MDFRRLFLFAGVIREVEERQVDVALGVWREVEREGCRCSVRFRLRADSGPPHHHTACHSTPYYHVIYLGGIE